MEGYLRAMDWIYRGCIWISGLAIIIMSLVIPWGVYSRKFLGKGAAWPEPVAVFCMVIFTFFGAAASYRAGGHIAVRMIVERLSTGKQRLIAYLVDLFMLLISLFMIVYGFRLSKAIWHQSVDTLPILKVGLTYLPLPLGSIAILLFIVERIIAGSQTHRPIVTFGQSQEETQVKGGAL